LKDSRRAIRTWFGVVGLICWLLIPIRVYVLSANDWLVWLLLALGIVFISIFAFITIVWKHNPTASTADS